MEIVLRPYQQTGNGLIKDTFLEGIMRILLVMPTGAGKTVLCAFIMQMAIAKGIRVAFICDRTNLVDQTSAVLESYGIPHGIIQASHWRRRPEELIQVCSAQTLESRGFPDDIGFLVVDEAHVLRKETTAFILSRPKMRVLGMTATPFTAGLDKLYERMVNTVTMNDLIEQKYLVPIKMFAAEAIDMTGAKVVAGEWSDKEVETRGREIIGNIVGCWEEKTLEFFGGPVKTIVFAATVVYGAELAERFQANGHNFQHLSYKDQDEDRRRELIAEFRKPNSTITGLIACEIFTKGFDCSDVLCGISARPYRKSLTNHIQQLGRVARSHPGKDFALWLDHSGNAVRFATETDDLFQNGVGDLGSGQHQDKPRKEPTEQERKQILCSCGFALPSYSESCPACGKVRKRMSDVTEIPGVMVEINGRMMKKGEEYLINKESVWKQMCWIADRKNPLDPKRAEWFAITQYTKIYGLAPPTYYSKTEKTWASPELQTKVRNLVKQYYKVKEAMGGRR